VIKKKSDNFEWLEFGLLQEFPNLNHSVSLTPPPPSDIILAKQVHGCQVRCISERPKDELICDALSTNNKNCPIGIKHADCQAAIIYDPVHHAVCCVHSGWRGSVQNIYREAVEHMGRHYQSDPNDLIFCVGPSLGPQSAEFIHYQIELPKSFWKYQSKPNYFDFWTITRHQVTACGILPRNIEIAELDTATGNFYSYRRDRKKDPHHITWVNLL